jgi:hypothetical protein
MTRIPLGRQKPEETASNLRRANYEHIYLSTIPTPADFVIDQ